MFDIFLFFRFNDLNAWLTSLRHWLKVIYLRSVFRCRWLFTALYQAKLLIGIRYSRNFTVRLKNFRIVTHFIKVESLSLIFITLWTSDRVTISKTNINCWNDFPSAYQTIWELCCFSYFFCLYSISLNDFLWTETRKSWFLLQLLRVYVLCLYLWRLKPLKMFTVLLILWLCQR